MLRTPHPAIGEAVDCGWLAISDALAARYRDAVSPANGRPLSAEGIPLGLLLSLRGEPVPAVELAADTVSVHGNHSLHALARLCVPGRFRVVAQLDDVFTKNGRSGPLTVIARSTQWLDEAGVAVARMQDQQIVRRAPADILPAEIASSALGRSAGETHPAAILVDAAARSAPEPGDTIAVEHRRAPDASAVRRYAEWMSAPEPLFIDRRFAQRLGFTDVIVPGPLQSALLEDLLAYALPDWSLQSLSCTFRISLIAAEPVVLRVVATERRGTDSSAMLALDLTIENSQGERATVGDATLCILG